MPATFTFMIVLLATTVANAFPAGNETVGVGGCKGCSGSGCICENAVKVSQPYVSSPALYLTRPCGPIC